MKCPVYLSVKAMRSGSGYLQSFEGAFGKTIVAKLELSSSEREDLMALLKVDESHAIE